MAATLTFSPKYHEALLSSALALYGTGSPSWVTRLAVPNSAGWDISRSGDLLLSGTSDGIATVYDITTGAELVRYTVDGAITGLDFSPDASTIAIEIDGTHYCFFDRLTGKERCRAEGYRDRTSAWFNESGSLYVLGSRNKGAFAIDATTGKEAFKVECKEGGWNVDFSADGKLLALPSDDKLVRIVSAQTGKQVQLFDKFEGKVTSVDFSPDSRFVLAGSQDKTCRLIDTSTGKERLLRYCDASVREVNFNPDGLTFATSLEDETVMIFSVQDPLFRIKVGHLTIPWHINYSPDGCRIAVQESGKGLALIDARTGRLLMTRNESGSYDVRFSRDGRWLLAVSSDRAEILEPHGGLNTGRLPLTDGVPDLAFSPHSKALSIASWDHSLRLVNVESAEVGWKSDFGKPVLTTDFSADGRRVVAGSNENKTLRLFEYETGKLVQNTVASGQVTHTNFVNGGSQVLVGSEPGVLELWDTTSNMVSKVAEGSIAPWKSKLGINASCTEVTWLSSDGEVTHLKGPDWKPLKRPAPKPNARGIAITPDGSTIALWIGKEIILVETETGKQRSAPIPLPQVAAVCSFSPDGRMIAVGQEFGWLSVFDIGSRENIFSGIIDGNRFIQSVGFSPDSRWLCAAARSGAKAPASYSDSCNLGIIDLVNKQIVVSIPLSGSMLPAAFSPDGQWLAAGVLTGDVRTFDTRWWASCDQEVSEAWIHALNTQSGRTISTEGIQKLLTGEQLQAEHSLVREYLRSEPTEDGKWQHAILRWSLMPPEIRTTSPWTGVSHREVVGRWLMAAPSNHAVIKDCADSAPWHPLVPISIARSEVPTPYKSSGPGDGGTNTSDATLKAATKLYSERARPNTTPSEDIRLDKLTRPRMLAGLTLARLKAASSDLYSKATLWAYAYHAASWMHDLGLQPEEAEARNLLKTADGGPPYAIPVPGQQGFYYSPFSTLSDKPLEFTGENGGEIDCPYSKPSVKIRIPSRIAERLEELRRWRDSYFRQSQPPPSK